MFLIGDTLVSEELFTEDFVCNLSKCKGECCVDGDSGAPLEDSELAVLDEIYEKIKPYLRKEGIEAIEEQGTYVKDIDGEWTTPLVKGKECAYVIFDDRGIAKCGIEKAWENGVTSFKKPISCHLYPVRLKKHKDFTAVNYHEWDICSPACALGKELKINVAHFVKDALIRKFGAEWYDELMKVESEFRKLQNGEDQS